MKEVVGCSAGVDEECHHQMTPGFLHPKLTQERQEKRDREEKQQKESRKKLKSK